MGFFKRLFSADYRAAVAAEAAGDLDLAAERYALAGQPENAVRIHLARADRADKRSDEIVALRDALHWSPAEGDLRKLVARRLGRALLARAEAEGIATARDKDRVRESARLLVEAGEYRRAGEALERIGDDKAAVAAYRKGGLVDRMEDALGREEKRSRQAREEREAFSDYELHLKGGDRDAALTAIRRAVEAADSKTEYRRLQDELESRLITGGKAVLRIRGGQEIALCTGPSVLIGRDPLCDMVLRSGGVSRRHSEVVVGKDGEFAVRDAGSRNGTKLAGMPIAGTVPLEGEGQFELGDDCVIGFTMEGEALRLFIESGFDAGKELRVVSEGDLVDLPSPPIQIRFRGGRPILSRDKAGLRVVLNGERLAHGDVQLIHRDQLSVDGIDFEVE
ncbi:MAG: FHA domain-containing protein [Deltaproteobacteria bacterium]|nr:FHA domain-containing protein [Deltaproteobacteria bacterium]